MRLALAWSVFCFLRRAPLTVSTDKAIRAPSFFRQDRAAIGIVTLRSPCVKHASVGCRAAHLRDWPKIFDRKREDFFVWKVEERRHTGVWPRDETNQTGKYSVSGTMLPESLCPGLQRRTPCPCSLSDSLRACQKNSYLTRSQGEQHCSPCAQDCQKGLRAAEAAPKAGRRVLLLPRPPSVQPPDIPRGYVRHRGSRSSPGAPGNYSP